MLLSMPILSDRTSIVIAGNRGRVSPGTGGVDTQPERGLREAAQ